MIGFTYYCSKLVIIIHSLQTQKRLSGYGSNHGMELRGQQLPRAELQSPPAPSGPFHPILRHRFAITCLGRTPTPFPCPGVGTSARGKLLHRGSTPVHVGKNCININDCGFPKH